MESKVVNFHREFVKYWELSQMLGRGGRDGNNAAFVIMLWTGQATWTWFVAP